MFDNTIQKYQDNFLVIDSGWISCVSDSHVTEIESYCYETV